METRVKVSSIDIGSAQFGFRFANQYIYITTGGAQNWFLSIKNTVGTRTADMTVPLAFTANTYIYWLLVSDGTNLYISTKDTADGIYTIRHTESLTPLNEGDYVRPSFLINAALNNCEYVDYIKLYNKRE